MAVGTGTWLSIGNWDMIIQTTAQQGEGGIMTLAAVMNDALTDRTFPVPGSSHVSPVIPDEFLLLV